MKKSAFYPSRQLFYEIVAWSVIFYIIVTLSYRDETTF